MREVEAAVLRGERDLSYETVRLDDPKRDEVRVDVRATGVCHTDFHAYADEVERPVVLGHEGAGVVEEVGEDVTSVEPGDHVVLFVLPTTADSTYTHQGKPYLDQVRKEIDGTMLDGTRRLHAEDGPLDHFYAQSSFATKAVVHERTAVRVDDDAPLAVASLLACGATTGIGAVHNTADVDAGETVAVVGCGGVGLSAVMGAKAASAGEIIAVDVVESKLDAASEFGATATVHAGEEDVLARVEEITDGGVDYALECIGRPETVRQSFSMLAPGGTAVVTGTSSTGPVEIDAGRFTKGVSLVGNVVGSARPHVDVPRYLQLYQNGDLPLDELITRRYDLTELDEAFEAMERGEVLRSVVTYD